MARSMLVAVRDAVAGAAQLTLESNSPDGGHEPSQTGGQSMSEIEGKPAAKTTTGISQAEHEAALAAARDEGRAAGAAEATARMGEILGADGIQGDGGRMSAALDLAVKSTGMSAGDVVAFVVANVGASKPDASAADEYEAERLSAAGLARPVAGKGKRSGLSQAIDKYAPAQA